MGYIKKQNPEKDAIDCAHAYAQQSRHVEIGKTLKRAKVMTAHTFKHVTNGHHPQAANQHLKYSNSSLLSWYYPEHKTAREVNTAKMWGGKVIQRIQEQEGKRRAER